jgi:outer membrane protein OmpA-like peptidoglycan-associated protein
MQDKPVARRSAFARAWPVALALALAACASHQPRTSPQTSAKPVAPSVSSPVAARATVADSGSYENKKKHIRQELGKNPSDALAPADVGYYLDVLQGRLKQIVGKNLAVERHGDRITLQFSHVDFDAGSAQINPSMRDTLAPVSGVLSEYRKTLVSVKLRSKEPGTPANPGITAKRAQAVAHYLATSGIVARRIVVTGSPGAPAETPEQLELELEPIVLDQPDSP